MNPRWISPNRMMPAHNQAILFLDNNIVKYGYYNSKGWWHYAPVNGFILGDQKHITHWMYLP